MTTYVAPLKDIRFTLRHICDLPALTTLPALEASDLDVIDAALDEAGKLAEEVLAPLNRQGDTEGATLENGVVRTPQGFKEAYDAYSEGGWNALPFDPAYGGMGLPWLIGNVCGELWNSSNMGFALCPLLNQGAVEALHAHGSDELKNAYLAKLISGEWAGTMNLTEPQAGSDVGALRARAEPTGDGRWKITGQKIFISYGEHDFTDNIIHLVLARTPDAPAGTRGISLFLVPKFLLNEDGSPGERNDLRCVSLEHKLGIHASPTAVMSYGDNGGAIGYMVGEENKGMRCMFTMMNAARLSVGIQGVAIAERAYQQAADFARERRQGKALGAHEANSAIIEHADVRRMLLTMKAHIDAIRAICYVTAEAIDLSRHHTDPDVREWNRKIVELLTPVAKAWSTDVGCEVASLGVQIHGGMGFIEETGAAQHFRDARITPIYEGTNGIQAMDLVMRKLPMDGGGVVNWQLDQMRATADALSEAGGELSTMGQTLADAVASLSETTAWYLETLAEDPRAAAAGCSPYLQMFGLTLGAYLLGKGALAARGALDAGSGETDFLAGRIATARFFGEQLLPRVNALKPAATAGADLLYAIEAESF